MKVLYWKRFGIFVLVYPWTRATPSPAFPHHPHHRHHSSKSNMFPVTGQGRIDSSVPANTVLTFLKFDVIKRACETVIRLQVEYKQYIYIYTTFVASG